MKEILSWIWQFPQNICGYIYKMVSKENRLALINHPIANRLGAEVLLKGSRGGVTLGKYVFIHEDDRDLEDTIIHELGHVKQSKILGPLYLLVIGLPSILHCWYNDFVDCCWEDGRYHYEHFYTESWAEKLMEGEINSQ